MEIVAQGDNVANLALHRARRWRILHAASNALEPITPIVMDVERVLPADDAPCLLFGPPAAFKSCIALHLCDSVASGRPFLGRYATRQRRALFVNVDAGPKSLRNRVLRVSAAPAFDFVTVERRNFDEAIGDFLTAYEGGFVVIDCLAAVFHGDQNDPEKMRAFLDELRATYLRHGCGGLVIDHTNRSGDYSHSVQKKAACRAMWQATPEKRGGDDDADVRRGTISCRKFSEGQDFGGVRFEVNFSQERVSFSAIERASSRRDYGAEILTWAREQSEPFSATKALKHVGGRDVEIRAAIRQLTDAGKLIEHGSYNGHARYIAAISSHLIPCHPG
jgi:hypothetical protein